MSRQAVVARVPSTGPSAKEQTDEIHGGVGVGHMCQGEAAMVGKR